MSTIGNFTPQDGIVHGTAKFVRVMDPKAWKGDARLYKLDPPLFGDVEHAVVSAVEETRADEAPLLALIGALLGADVPVDGGPETLLVPTDEDGNDYSEVAAALNLKHSRELIGLVTTRTTDHVEFLAGVGYEVQA